MSWPKSSYRATTSSWPRKCKPTSPPTSPPPKSKTPMATESAPECALCSTSSPSTKPPPTKDSHYRVVQSLRGTKQKKRRPNSKLLNPIFTIFKNPILDTQIKNELQYLAPKRIKPSAWQTSITSNRNELSGKP